MEFLSVQSIALHKKYLETLKLRLSVFESSYPLVAGVDLCGIANTRVRRGEKEEMIRLMSEIKAHEIYFSSFLKAGSILEKNGIISKQFGSEAQFLYELMQYARDKCGFLMIYQNLRGDIRAYAGEEYFRVLKQFDVKLAIDLCEHAYFSDYGFDKEKYLSKALSSLNLSRFMEKNILQNR